MDEEEQKRIQELFEKYGLKQKQSNIVSPDSDRNEELKRIEDLKQSIVQLEKELHEHDSSFPNYSPINRAKKEIELLEVGFKVSDIKHAHHGFVILDKYMIAYQQKKWCSNSKRVWYFYDDLGKWRTRYILNQSDKKEFNTPEFTEFQNKINEVHKLNEYTSVNNKTFINSISTFLNERGFLTPKQEKALDDIIQYAEDKREKKNINKIFSNELINQQWALN